MRCGVCIVKDRADLRENSRPTSGRPAKSMFDNSVGKLSSYGSLSDINGLKYSFNPEMWRTWSSQRAGFTDTEFEGFSSLVSNVVLSAMFGLNNVLIFLTFCNTQLLRFVSMKIQWKGKMRTHKMKDFQLQGVLLKL